MAIQLGDVRAVAGEGGIGRITWFSIRSFEMARDTLLEKWREAGLPEGDFLPETRAPDAFKQAVKVVLDREGHAGEDTIIRYTIRGTEGRPHIRHVIREYIKKGEEKPYTYRDIGRFVFNPADYKVDAIWHPTADEPGADAEWAEVVAMVKTRYDSLMETHNDIDVRLALQKRLRHWHSLLLRPTGGVYFVPKDFGEEADRYAAFLRSIGSEMWALTVASDAAPMVHEKFEAHKAEVNAELEKKRAEAAAVPVEDTKKKKSLDDEIAEEMGRMAEMERRYGLF